MISNEAIEQLKNMINIAESNSFCAVEIDAFKEDAILLAIANLTHFRWISVDESLPGSAEQCLVTDADGEMGVGFYREDAKAWDSCNWGWLERKHRVDNKDAYTEPCGIGKVVKWMHLPDVSEFN